MAMGLLLAAGACLSGGGDARGTTMRDSAGVVIVDNPDPRTADSTSWIVDTTPRIRIGVLEGPDELMFGTIADAVRLDDGRIAIADKQTNDIRFFDLTGRFLERVGGHGQGPGEFVNFSNLYRTRGDSLIVTDYEGGRHHVLDSRGRYARRHRLAIRDDIVRRQYTSPRLHATFDDGSLLLTDHIPCASGRQPGICIDSARFMRVVETGERLTSFGNHVHMRDEILITSGGDRAYVRQWQPQPFWTAHGSRFYFADAATGEIRIYAWDGRLERIVRANYHRPAPPGSLPAPPWAATDSIGRRLFENTNAATRPDRLPAFSGFRVDRVGNLWVMEYVAFWQPAPRPTARWWVFDSTGVLRHTLFVPWVRQARPWVGGTYRGPEIGDDYILGMRSTRDGVEQIVMFDLRKMTRP